MANWQQPGCVLLGTRPHDFFYCMPACFWTDALTQNLTRPSRKIWISFAQHDPCLLWKNRTKLDAGSQIRHIQSGPILAMMAITVCNQTLPNWIQHVYWEVFRMPVLHRVFLNCLLKQRTEAYVSPLTSAASANRQSSEEGMRARGK